MSPETVVQVGPCDRELLFTETYRRHMNDHPALREAHCLPFGRSYAPIRDEDLLAGRHIKVEHDPEGLLVGFGLEHEDSGRIYYHEPRKIRQRLEKAGVDGEYRRRVEDMIAFWDENATFHKFLRGRSDELHRRLSTRVANQGIRLAGVLLNFDKLVRIGYPGLVAELRASLDRVRRSGGDASFLEGCEMALGQFARVCRDYAEQAREQAAASDKSPERRRELETMAGILDQILVSKPESFRAGMQLAWMYAIVTGVTNYGRLDVYLGDLYARDVDSGVLDEAGALRLLESLWRLIAAAQYHFNSRVIVGGRGRRNEANADRLALLAIEATRRVVETEPQLSLRFYQGQNPALMKKALDVLGEGRTFPILYNDDVNVPAVMNAFRVHETEAAHYQPYGCGEYGLDHIAFGSPNSSFNILAALDATLRGGRAVHGCKTCGACGGTMTHRHDVPEADEFKNFDEFFEAFQGQVRYYGRTLAQAHALELEVERKDAAFLFPSMLMDGCLESGRSLVDGGVKYLGGISESMGMVNTADALAAIKKIVFEEKRVSLDQLVRMLDANWLGYERERQLFLNAPKYGNDEPEVDRILREIARTACNAVRDAASEVGMDYYLLVNIMNHVHVGVGKEMGATPDGRKAGMPLANAGSPTAGNDKKGVTAYLNSITSFEPELHAGFVFNLKLGRRMFREDRAKLEALLGAYWARGGSQIMITCVNRDDLVQAMERPEEHHNLIVRVGGFSARFVELNRDLQLDLIKRTFYE